MPDNKGKVYISLILFTVIWGWNLIAVKLISEHSQPVTVSGLRLFAAGCLVLVYVIWKKQYRKINLREGMQLLLICITGMALHHSLLSFGVTLTSAVHASLIMAFAPLTTSVLAYFILRDRLTIMNISGIFMGIAGISLIIWNDVAGFSIKKGDLLVLASMFCQSLSFIFIKKLRSSLSDAYMTGILLTAGGMILLILGWFVEKTPVGDVFTGMNYELVTLFVCSAFLATAVGSVVWNQSVRVLGPGKASVFLNTVPFYGIFGAFLILQEKVFMYHVIGLFLVVAGVILGNTAYKKDCPNPKEHGRLGQRKRAGNIAK